MNLTPLDAVTECAPARPKALVAIDFTALAQAPLILDWFAHFQNEKTSRAYRRDAQDFTAFAEIHRPEDFCNITHDHLVAWQKDLEQRQFAPSSICRKLAALTSLFRHLHEKGMVTHNPVEGIKRPLPSSQAGLTPTLSEAQARALLDAPSTHTLKGIRDRAILAILLYHGLRREELCKLEVQDLHQREGVLHLRVNGKGGKLRFIPVANEAAQRIVAYLEKAGHGADLAGALFRPVKNNTTGFLQKSVNPASVYQAIVRHYGEQVGINANVRGFCVHSLRATAAINALAHGADLAGVQQWLGHAKIATTRRYDKRQHRPEENDPSL